MSREVNTKNASRLSQDDLHYAVQRDMLTPAQLKEVGLDSRQKIYDFLRGEAIDPNDREYSGNHLILSDDEIELIKERREQAESAPTPKIRKTSAIEEDEEADDYEEGWTNDTRREELAGRDLPVDGNKEELIMRLKQDDSERAQAAADEQASQHA